MRERDGIDRRDVVVGGGAALAGVLGASGLARAGDAVAATDATSGSTRVVNVKDFGGRGDGVADDTPAVKRAMSAVDQSRVRTPLYFPAGVYRLREQFGIPSNTTVLGDGSGRTELQFSAGSSPAVVAGQGGVDWSDSEIRGVRVRADPKTGADGYGLEIVNPTNSSSVVDVSVFGFREGQILVDNAGKGPGPNFFRLSGFFVGGGRNPLHIVGGRQTVLVEYGGVDLDPSSRQGLLIEGGEAQARTVLVTAVKVEGTPDVPGFAVRGLAPCTFLACTRYNAGGLSGKLGRQAAFLYNGGGQVALQVELVACTSLGVATLFSAPDLGVRVPGDRYGRYSGAILSGSNTMVVPFSRGSLDRRSLTLHKDVHLSWTGSSGSSGRLDTSLYRSASGTVKTDGRFVAAGGIATRVTHGPPTDSAPEGSIAVDAQNGKLYVRVGKSWRSAQLS